MGQERLTKARQKQFFKSVRYELLIFTNELFKNM